MRKFILNIFFLIVILGSLYAIVSANIKTNQTVFNDYTAAIIDKHSRIKEINAPKIIFAGGSNLAFGLNSEEVEKEFSVPVVNLGLHGGLGLKFILNELKSVIKNKDVVFLSIEYFQGNNGNYGLKNNISKNYGEAKKYYTTNLIDDAFIHIDKTREFIKTKIDERTGIDFDFSTKSKLVPLVYSRESFDKYGDFIGHLGKIAPDKLRDRRIFTYIYWPGIEEINEFAIFAKKKNVSVFFLYPNYPDSQFKKNEKVINMLSQDLS